MRAKSQGIKHTWASKTTPLRSSIHKSFWTRLPSSRGSKQFVKQIKLFGEVMVVALLNFASSQDYVYGIGGG